MSLRILIADDSPINLKLLERYLLEAHYEVLKAVNGQELVQMLDATQPDLIILDGIMPELDGFKATKLIKNNAKYAHIPVIIVTALDDVKNRIKALKCGADDVIHKPIDNERLQSRIKAIMRSNLFIESMAFLNFTKNILKEDPIIKQLLKKSYITEGSKVLMIETENNITETLLNCESFLSKEDIETNIIMHEDQISNFGKNNLIIVNGINIHNSEDNLEKLFALSAKIKSQRSSRDIPMMAIVSDANNVIINGIINAGFEDYIALPLNKDEFIARCAMRIQKHIYKRALQHNYEVQLIGLNVDHLTKLYNRAYFEAHLINLIESNSEEHRKIFLMLVDIDDFKLINDRYGHSAGDRILKQFADRILQHLKIMDMFTRWGGEEFIILLTPNSDEECYEIAERIRKSIADTPFQISDDNKNILINCTCSIGGGILRDYENEKQLLNRIDLYMYEVKREGKNNIRIVLN